MTHEERLAHISERLAKIEDEASELRLERAKLVVLMRKQGLSLADIAKHAKITRQGVLQISNRFEKQYGWV